ncbi:uncharacterized protein [Anabrus simplex]|uniref:uncharacterized protein isoform X4 n=1 Tax=Anabrus simplex TaxID=316456 RepID=UPI0034DCD463
MEELVFIKCEPKWPSDTEEGLSNFGQNTFPTSDCQVKIKEDPRAIDADLSLEEVDVKIDMEEVDIKMDKEPCSDEDGVGDAHDEGCDNTGGSSHEADQIPKMKVRNPAQVNGSKGRPSLRTRGC